jgi:hypothetical protein
MDEIRNSVADRDASPRVVASVLWQNPFDRSTDRCRLLTIPSGFALDGTVLVPVDDEPVLGRYRVEVDDGWRVTSAMLTLEGPAWSRAVEIRRDDGTWVVDGTARDDLGGCVDVDLRITPATNTLPIRRLGLPVGEGADVRAAWVGFPGLELEPLDQRYERLAKRRYRYIAGEFTEDLDVDAAGLVLRYGTRYWAALAHTNAEDAMSRERPSTPEA